MRKNAIIIIPAYKPSKIIFNLIGDLSDSLQFENFNFHFVVVDDGSGAEYDDIFHKVGQSRFTVVLRSAQNNGKGHALKTAFEYVLNTHVDGYVIATVDADGQHSPKDVIRLLKHSFTNDCDLVLGVREFSGHGVPWRSKFGNILSRYVLFLCTGKFISDTQTGLRILSKNFSIFCTSLQSNRYEFETEMLIYAFKNKVSVCEFSIETIYEKNNPSSHFNPILDSMRIYFVFLRFIASSLLAVLIDFIFFYIFLESGFDEIIGLLFARVLSLSASFFLIKFFVFRIKKRSLYEVSLFIGLAFFLFLITSASLLLAPAFINPILIKAITESSLFLISFFVQKRYIFKSAKNFSHQSMK